MKCDVILLVGFYLTQKKAEKLGKSGWVIHYRKISREFEGCVCWISVFQRLRKSAGGKVMALRGLVSMMTVKLQSRKPKREMPALEIRLIQGVEKNPSS